MSRDTHPLVWIAVGAVIVAGYFVVIEEAPPKKLVALVSESSDSISGDPAEPDATPTPITKEALLARADFLKSTLSSVEHVAAEAECTAAVKIVADASREIREKYGYDTDRDIEERLTEAVERVPGLVEAQERVFIANAGLEEALSGSSAIGKSEDEYKRAQERLVIAEAEQKDALDYLMSVQEEALDRVIQREWERLDITDNAIKRIERACL